MQRAFTRIKGRVARLDLESRPGFYLSVAGGRAVYCLAACPDLIEIPRPGQSVIVTGEWSTAIIGFFEAHEVRVADGR
jgi:hypothetical protein